MCTCKLLIECYFLQDNFASDAFFDMASGLLQLYTNVMLVSNWLENKYYFILDFGVNIFQG